MKLKATFFTWQTICRVASFLLLMGTLVLIQSCGGDDEDPTITDEGLYINELYASGDDWLELYNSGSATRDISGYRIYDDHTKKYTLPAGTVIPANGYLVLFCDETSTGLHTSFKLSADGEVIAIENTAGILIDRVDFPALNNGQSYARYPNGSGTFIVTGTTTQGVTNGETPTPVINDITKAPFIPGKSDNTKISTKVTHSAGISSVKLFYKFNESAFTSITMTFVVNDIYEATIPATGADGEVEFYIEAKSKSNETALSPENAPDKLHDYHINSDVLPQLVINEFMAANTSCCPDKDGGVDEFDDWIEIYNKGAVAVNIADMYLSDDVLDPFKFHVPKTNAAKTTIQPGGYLVIWADESKSQGELHANFKLSASGESVGLYYVDGRTIDKYEYGQQNDNKSFGRITDGAATWKEFSTATPGASNQ